MNGSFLFWSLALGWMAAMVLILVVGVRRVRVGDLDGHRRAMHTAIGMVLVFVVGYVVKVLWLGKEDLASWTSTDRGILYFHESMVAVMVLAGGTARWLARPFRVPAGRAPSRVRWHRLAGRLAVAASTLALVTAGLILAGMARRGTASGLW